MIIQCHECGAQVSTEARACVHCGAPPKKGSEYGTAEISASDFVSFEAANYEVSCPTCGSAFLVKGKLLATKEFIKCPYPHVAGQTQKISSGAIRVSRVANGHVIYRRFSDFFSYAGRISVADYWLSALIALPIHAFISLIPGPAYPIIFFGLLHSLWVKRYHDHGMRGEWVAIQGFAAVTSSVTELLMPNVLASGQSYPAFGAIHGIATLAALVTGIAITFIPGKSKTNRYGPPKSEVKRVWW